MERLALRELMARDLQGKASVDEVGPLRTRSNVGVWYEELVARKRELDTQFTNRKVKLAELHSQFRRDGWADESRVRYQQAEVRYNEWRLQAVILQGCIEARIAEARELKKKYLKSAKQTEKSPELIDLLKRAAKLIARTGPGAIWHDDLERFFW